MRVDELIEQLEQYNGDREVYVTMAGEYYPAKSAKRKSHERLSIEPYKDEDFILIA